MRAIARKRESSATQVKGANRLESSLEEQEREAVHELLQRITGKEDTPATQAELMHGALVQVARV